MYLDNTQEYTNLTDYSLQLRKTIKDFEIMIYLLPRKQAGSFKVSLQTLENILENIKTSQELLGKMEGMSSLDSVAKQENKNARKVSEQISDVRRDLRTNIDRLREQYFKQLEICYKQYQEFGKMITDKVDREKFLHGERTQNFRRMMWKKPEVELFSESDWLVGSRKAQKEDGHKDQEKHTNDVYSFREEYSDKLQEALNLLSTTLSTTPDTLATKVRREVAQIKKALPPKTITITKESLDKLRHSDQLLLDLEQINEVLQTTYSFLGKDGKLQKVNKKLDKLKHLLGKALDEERERKETIKREYDDVQRKVDYATEAVKTYDKILYGNDSLEQEQIRIGNKTHHLHAENESLKKENVASYEEIARLRSKDDKLKEWDHGLKIDKLYENIREADQLISNNEQYMADKMAKQKVIQLPPEYTNMKNKLKNMSSLYKIGMTQSQNLSGGMSR